MTFTRLRLILGDQLNAQHSWFDHVSDDTLYLIIELKQETDYVKHHVQKICAFFAAMEQFAQTLQQAGHQVQYIDLDQSVEKASLCEWIVHLCLSYQVSQFEYQRPDEYRLAQQLAQLDIPNTTIQAVDSEHFIVPFEHIPQSFPKGNPPLMEHFYRRMRKTHQLLLDEAQKPLGGKWNYDADNRKKLSAADLDALPKPLLFANSVETILARLTRHRIKTIGVAQSTLIWPINRGQALNLLAHFCRVCLPHFGQFQDAMTNQHNAAWSLYHSRLSFALNSKILSPMEVIHAAISTYQHPEHGITLAQIEGFVRQILGWREYVRGVYWSEMPSYATTNALAATRPLPSYFWNGETKMACVREAVSQSLEYAYAHHIQRLMITGNFALLTGIHPDQVDAWYLGIYIDAIEWVEMPNTRGMALHADGGIVGTKPYAASGAYINKMSDYCKHCFYQVKQRSGEGACPFNSLYWHFIDQHQSAFNHNPRMSLVMNNWYKQTDEEKAQILSTARHYLHHIESL
ncbi:cryptochrome/photolyase family protein [Vibrio sp. IRLE0018]|uniref:cryptochrome/photolyase family protein n=1 Tax=Vibrio floridensis TaxID=2908007 RepID=UPI001F3EA2E9|nr:cryptochrome/photolyase family protein [Vibrio floridensis]MCF8779222.1 cryptochrome/photolyase family protein [Vibrio floridensis]